MSETAETASSEAELIAHRIQKRDALTALGIPAFPNDFRVDTSVADFVRCYHEGTHEALVDVRLVHHLAGRVMAINSFGKAAFVRIQDRSCDEVVGTPVGRLQVYLRKDALSEADFALLKHLDLGDFIGVSGTPMRTKTGELTVAAQSVRILSKSMRPLPEKWHGLADVEKRYRQRHLDLITNPDSRRVFLVRSQVIAWLRHFFSARGFLEVETPMMHPIAGGAAARPFITHHNTLDMQLYLRIAPELYLKRLIVGGFERVFEINRNFRNEGLSTHHNPEFTTLEFYQAYADYQELMGTTETLLSGVCEAVLGTTDVPGETPVSLKAPFARLSMVDSIGVHGGPTREVVMSPDASAQALERLGLFVPKTHGGRIVALFEHFVEDKLVQPTFIYDFPAEVSPLARRSDQDPFIAERFELYVQGRELVNAFSELNDPIDQRTRFMEQLAQRQAGDDEAHQMDEDYVRTLEHGMPPTAGFGLGIDRLVMLLTGARSIRDVILFPLLRSEA